MSTKTAHPTTQSESRSGRLGSVGRIRTSPRRRPGPQEIERRTAAPAFAGATDLGYKS
jgi:hypothetical protein